MDWFTKYIMGSMILMDKAGEGGSGGGGGGQGNQGGQQGQQGQGGQGGQQGQQGQQGNQGGNVTLTQAQFDAIMAKLNGTPAGGQGGQQGQQGQGGQGNNEGDLADKARREADEKAKRDKETKTLSSAIRFNMGVKDWAKNNSTLLPKSVSGIIDQAEKQNYGSEAEKANDIKLSIFSEFFAVQTNVDLLTEAQKVALADFKNLTKNDKQERIQQAYEQLFEPTLERLRDATKAKQLSMGHGTQTDAEAAYRDKLIKGARKHYLGEKQNA
jgi:hypothetical protein